MPIYEYSCNACKSPVSVFVRSMSSEVNASCEKCGSTDLTRLVSQVSIPKFGAPGSEGGFDMNDPQMAAMMQQMGGMGGMGGMPGMGGMGGFGGMDDFGDDDF
jgi:putative FmdB family regulatory protein